MNNQQLQEKRGDKYNTPTCHSQQLPAMWRSLWLLERWPQIKLEMFELYLKIQNCTATSWCVSASTNELCGTEERGWCCCSTFGFYTVPMSFAALSQEQGSLEQEHRAAAPEECGS